MADDQARDACRRQRDLEGGGLWQPEGQASGGSRGGESLGLADWIDYAFGFLAFSCGLDEQQIERTTVVHFRRLERYAGKFPPTHLIGRAFIKIPEQRAKFEAATPISPDARSPEEKAADAARVAAIKAKAPKREQVDRALAPLLAAAAKNGGHLSMDALR